MAGGDTVSRHHPQGLLQDGQELLDGKYVVERFLGEGAFAEVYRVQHEFFGRQALKVFRGGGMTHGEITSVLGEAVMLSKIEHPNIVRVFDAGTVELDHGPYGYFTMEFVGGGSLDRYWKSHGDRLVPVDKSVDVLRQICKGLAAAHRESPPIVHRDVKPPNILVGIDANGLRVRLSDFGLAKRVDPLTLMATARGTLAFKAPETFRGRVSDSCAGDMWAVGTVAYLLLTDEFPYGNLADEDIIRGAYHRQSVFPPSRLNIDVDPELDRIVLKALAVDPDVRYPSATEMLDDLAGWSPRTGTEKRAPQISATSKYETSAAAVSSLDEEEAMKLRDRALELSRQVHTLAEAADLMEEAFNKSPGLREQYAGRVRLWRNGVMR
jgi:eukaryotic-like serine/threonine-protein kinase